MKVKITDMEKCIGCEACEKACEFLNRSPRARVQAAKDGVLVPITCQHCTGAVCVTVCPTGALYKHEGSVRFKRSRCVGCKLCVSACPFGVPEIDAAKGFMVKCDLCAEREREGLSPACVDVCPAGAIIYGDIDEAEASESRTVKLLSEKKIVHKEEKP